MVQNPQINKQYLWDRVSLRWKVKILCPSSGGVVAVDPRGSGIYPSALQHAGRYFIEIVEGPQKGKKDFAMSENLFEIPENDMDSGENP